MGETLGFRIWIPVADRSRVLEHWTPRPGTLLDELSVVFNRITLKTVSNIDVLWIKNMTVIRAFEVEGTTAIYSGLLRMADLLALQSSLDIPIHIVAPVVRRELVLEQLDRPVFQSLGKGGLKRVCTYLSYDSVYELAAEKNLPHMNHTVLDDYAESAD